MDVTMLLLCLFHENCGDSPAVEQRPISLTHREESILAQRWILRM